MTMRPGPTIAARVSRRARNDRRAPVSPTLIVPSAPRMSPMCASSRTAVLPSSYAWSRLAMLGRPPAFSGGADVASRSRTSAGGRRFGSPNPCVTSKRRAPSSFGRTSIGAQGFSLVVPKLQSAWVEPVGHGPPRRTPRRTPLVRALAPAAVGRRASHLGRSLVPGKSVLTRSVFRQVGSVACVRRAASPNEVRLLARGCYPGTPGRSSSSEGNLFSNTSPPGSFADARHAPRRPGRRRGPSCSGRSSLSAGGQGL